MIYAVIKENVVDNIIVAYSPIEGMDCVDITEASPRPQLGWFYEAGVFTTNEPELEGIAVNTIPDPIILSNQMQVRIEDGRLFIGCETFDINWSNEALTEFFENDAPSVGPVTATRSGVKFGEFFVSWEDCERIREFLNNCG